MEFILNTHIPMYTERNHLINFYTFFLPAIIYSIPFSQTNFPICAKKKSGILQPNSI